MQTARINSAYGAIKLTIKLSLNITPDSRGRVYINSATNTVSWGWAGRIVNTAYPGGITRILRTLMKPLAPERQPSLKKKRAISTRTLGKG